MFNLIFKENVQGRKHSRSCAFAEPELLSYRNPKLQKVIQNEKKVNKNPNNNHNYQDENHDDIELYQRNTNRST